VRFSVSPSEPRPERREDAAADDPCRSLDVVIEARDAVAVVVQQRDGVVLLEVLPVSLKGSYGRRIGSFAEVGN
jgi:hypothetical protein